MAFTSEEWAAGVAWEEYLAGVELGVNGDQVLELRRRVLGLSIPMLIRGDDQDSD